MPLGLTRAKRRQGLTVLAIILAGLALKSYLATTSGVVDAHGRRVVVRLDSTPVPVARKLHITLVARPPPIPTIGLKTQFSDYDPAQDAGNAKEPQDDNTAGITAEDVARWRNTRIWPLEKEVELSKPDDHRSEIWHALAPWLQVGETYPDPFAVEFTSEAGPTIGEFYSKAHKNASVLSLTTVPASVALQGNFIAVKLPAKFQNFFSSCHMFNSAFLLGDWQAIKGSSLLEQLLPMARVTYVEIPDSSAADTRLFETSKTKATEIIRTKTSSIYRVVLLETRRTCRKTWVAPEEQWGRKTSLEYSAATGAVKFEVTSTKRKLARAIHPMQFIPHINLETLLALGLTTSQRAYFLGEQLQIPRYPDPMVHNWIWARGLRRIDKVDKRYEKDVSEAVTFWGKETFGYIVLLADNLCLPVMESGYPEAMVRCGKACTCCSTTCTYAPTCTPGSPYCNWGTPPCDLCVACGNCLKAARASSASSIVQCPFQKYKSWKHAMRIWETWERRAPKQAGEPWIERYATRCDASSEGAKRKQRTLFGK